MRTSTTLLTALLAAAALTAAGCSVEEDTTSSGDASATKPAKGKEAASCGTKATDDCTPHVGSNGSVRVDALTWDITSARVTKTLGDQEYGLGEEANGRFLVVKLHVRSDKDESATLTDDVVKLEVGGNSYSTDLDGTTAAIGAGEDPFFLESIGPDSELRGTVVFDVPPGVLAKKLELRFNELGFGEPHGYIRLPAV